MLPPIFILSFFEEPWKRIRIYDHCRERGILPVLIQGISGNTLGLRSVTPLDIDQHGKEFFVHQSQISKALSYRIALGAAISHGFSEFIIAEDDVWFSEKFAEKWDEFRDDIPMGASVVQLGYMDDHVKIEPVNAHVGRSAPFPFCSTCTWWHVEGAGKAIDLLGPFDRPLDIMLIQRVYPYLSHYVARSRMAFDFQKLQTR